MDNAAHDGDRAFQHARYISNELIELTTELDNLVVSGIVSEAVYNRFMDILGNLSTATKELVAELN